MKEGNCRGLIQGITYRFTITTRAGCSAQNLIPVHFKHLEPSGTYLSHLLDNLYVCPFTFGTILRTVLKTDLRNGNTMTGDATLGVPMLRVGLSQ